MKGGALKKRQTKGYPLLKRNILLNQTKQIKHANCAKRAKRAKQATEGVTCKTCKTGKILENEKNEEEKTNKLAVSWAKLRCNPQLLPSTPS